MFIKSSILFYISIIMAVLVLFTNSCKKKSEPIPSPVFDSFTDTVNHIIYKTVKIGNQWWMAENLKGIKYRNGVTIAQLQLKDSVKWKNDSIGVCCAYDDNITAAPGLLYNWNAVSNTNNMAPVGWHVPSDDEWKELEMHLGMSATDAEKTSWRGTNQGEKLKIASEQNWTSFGNIWSTNESGFTALAGACRIFNGIWGQPGLGATGFWWSSTSHGNEAWYRYLDYKNANVFRYYGPKTYGFSVRCVKD